MKTILNLVLLVSFLLTILAPLTGIHLHKLASVVFLLLTVIHTVLYRKRLNGKRWALLLAVVASFLTGLLGMIFDAYPVVLALHRAGAIVLVFFLAIHIFVFHRRLLASRKNQQIPPSLKRPKKSDKYF